ncbi:MAG: hypothetical protein NTV34_01060 [Proteobacteria bacterium]|nr:hypothetical protein [Pseudomonadota bacterium]
MENQSNKAAQEAPKVINLFGARKQADDAKAADGASNEASKVDEKAFNEAMQKNMDNAERLRKERLKANQGVLKSYRIKN